MLGFKKMWFAVASAIGIPTNPECENRYYNAIMSLSPVAYYRLGEKNQSFSLNDDFTGTNGNSPDANIWSTNGSSVNIQNNELKIISTDQNSYARTIDSYNGDIDFSVMVDNRTTAGLTNTWAGIGIQKVSNGSIWFIGYESYANGYTMGILEDGYQYHREISGQPINPGDTLRVTRVNEITKFYVWNGSDWDLLRTGAFKLIGDARPILLGYSEYASLQLEINFDDFIMTAYKEATIAVDETGNYNGEYMNNPTLGVPGLLVGDDNTAVGFDGVDDFVNYPSISSSNQTISLIFRSTHILDSSYKGIITKALTTTNLEAEYILRLEGDSGYLVYIQSSDSGDVLQISNNFNMHTGDIFYVAIVKQVVGNSDLITMYIDGVAVNSQQTSGWHGRQTGIGIILGKLTTDSASDRYFKGTIDEVCIHDKALTQEEITSLYEESQSIFPYAYNLTIDHTKVNEDLYDFPILVNLGSSSGITDFDSENIFNIISSGSLGINKGFDPNTSDSNLVLTNDNKTVDGNDYVGFISAIASQTINTGRIGYFEFTLDFDGTFMMGFCESNLVSNDMVTNLLNGFAIYQNAGTVYLRVGNTNHNASLPKIYVSNVISLTLEYDGMILTTWKNGVHYDTFDLINDYGIPQYTDKCFLAVTTYKTPIITIRLTEPEFTESIPIGATPWVEPIESNTKIIKATYNNPADNPPLNTYADTVNAIGPVAYWRLGESSGITAVDETGNYNGSYINNPDLGEPGLLVNDNNQSVYLNGNNNYIDANDLPRFTDGTNDLPFSICLLIKINSIGINKGAIFARWDGIGTLDDGELIISLNDSGEFIIQLLSKNTSNRLLLIGETLVVDVVYHIVITYDGSELASGVSFYLNGVSKELTDLSTGIYTGMKEATGTSSPLIGVSLINDNTYKRYFDGTIDEFTVFYKVITYDEIVDLYNSSITGSSSPEDPNVLTQQCKVEIDRWDQGNKQAQLWIKVPYISKDVDTIVNLNFDPSNPDNSTNIGTTGESPAQEVWANYDAVYHLSSDGADSTANVLDGTLVNMDDSNIVDFGIGKGLSFNGVDEYISLPDLTHGSAGEFSVSIDAISNNSSNRSATMAFNYSTNSTDPLTFIRFNSNPDDIRFYVAHTGVAQDYTKSSIDVLSYHNYTFNSVESGGLSAYIDGIDLVANTTGTGTYFFGNADGQRNNNIGSDRTGTLDLFDGTLKELRFSKNTKSDNYISTNYNSTQDELITFSDDESYDPCNN